MKKAIAALALGMVSTLIATQVVLAATDDGQYTEDATVGTTWGCIKKISTSNPCPIPDDPPDKKQG